MRDNLDKLRHIEGFPLGEDEDLHAISDPPHYTTYPNPHIAEFMQKYGKPYCEATDDYHREPYVTDVSEGKNDPIYNAHSYHTKVPYKAIIPFIEHYTEPGDIVFDGFCGTGMTGVAAQLARRRTILCDLSPIAAFIAYNYNTQVNIEAFTSEAMRVLRNTESDCKWMYKTCHKNGEVGYINHTIWSDVFICPYCKTEIVFWDVAVNESSEEVLETFYCKNCGAQLSKGEMDHAVYPVFDVSSGKNISRAKQVPVLINYTVNGERYNKKPDADDHELIRKIEDTQLPHWFPTTRIDQDIDIWYERDYRQLGVYSVDAFYTKRNLWTLAAQWAHISHIRIAREKNAVAFAVTGNIYNLSKMNRWPRLRGPLAGTLYIPSIFYEINPITALSRRIEKVKSIFYKLSNSLTKSIITTQSVSGIDILDADSVDYIFTDPPFGSNIIYSDLSIVWEAWLRIFTPVQKEIVVHRRKQKNAFSLEDYRRMMTHAFTEMYRVLKPGHWITVVFHNSKAAVWNVIQESLAKAGFLVAQVTVLDKQQGSFKQVTAAGAVKNDLVINAYKPRANFTQRFISQAGLGLETDFVREHLCQLPLAANIERSKEMLYSKYLAYYVQHGYQVQYNGEQFYRALFAWGLVERDGYWFADETQAQEYEQRKTKTFGKKGPKQQAVLFVSDEKSARQWLWDFLSEPKPFSDIHTAYYKALMTSEDQVPDPKDLLEESFVRADGDWKRPDALTQAELEKKRQERLLRQFDEYLKLSRAGQKLKEVRQEALVIGFTEAYRASRFQDILTVSKKLEKRLLEESPDLLDFVDIAETKLAD